MTVNPYSPKRITLESSQKGLDVCKENIASLDQKIHSLSKNQWIPGGVFVAAVGAALISLAIGHNVVDLSLGLGISSSMLVISTAALFAMGISIKKAEKDREEDKVDLPRLQKQVEEMMNLS